MPSTIEKCKLFRIKHATFLEGGTFLRNKHKNCSFLNKVHIFFLVEKKTPLDKYAQTQCDWNYLKIVGNSNNRIGGCGLNQPYILNLKELAKQHTNLQ